MLLIVAYSFDVMLVPKTMIIMERQINRNTNI